MTLKPTLVMLKILQKYCHLNFIHVPEEILHKNIFWVYLYSSWKTASCGLGIQMYWRNQNYMSGEDLKWPVWSVTVYIHLIYIWLFESLYSWMCTVYMLHKVNLLEGFFSLNLFFFFFKLLSETRRTTLGRHGKHVVTGFSLTLPVPLLINHELILQICHSTQ